NYIFCFDLMEFFNPYIYISSTMLPRSPISTLFPYTTLFRSFREGAGRLRDVAAGAAVRGGGGAGRAASVRGDVYPRRRRFQRARDRKSTRLNSSHVKISYAVFCLKKKSTTKTIPGQQSKKAK